MRLLSGEKTPLCKNICCGNGCQSPFCGLRLFFAQRLSFVFIIYVGERTVVTVLKMLLLDLQEVLPHFFCIFPSFSQQTEASFVFLCQSKLNLLSNKRKVSKSVEISVSIQFLCFSATDKLLRDDSKKEKKILPLFMMRRLLSNKEEITEEEKLALSHVVSSDFL